MWSICYWVRGGHNRYKHRHQTASVAHDWMSPQKRHNLTMRCVCVCKPNVKANSPVFGKKYFSSFINSWHCSKLNSICGYAFSHEYFTVSYCSCSCVCRFVCCLFSHFCRYIRRFDTKLKALCVLAMQGSAMM